MEMMVKPFNAYYAETYPKQFGLPLQVLQFSCISRTRRFTLDAVQPLEGGGHHIPKLPLTRLVLI